MIRVRILSRVVLFLPCLLCFVWLHFTTFPCFDFTLLNEIWNKDVGNGRISKSARGGNGMNIFSQSSFVCFASLQRCWFDNLPCTVSTYHIVYRIVPYYTGSFFIFFWVYFGLVFYEVSHCDCPTAVLPCFLVLLVLPFAWISPCQSCLIWIVTASGLRCWDANMCHENVWNMVLETDILGKWEMGGLGADGTSIPWNWTRETKVL